VQRSHAPCGELNEKIRGSSSGIDVPHFRHANFSENGEHGARPLARQGLHLDDPVGQRHRGLDGVGQALATSPRMTRRSTTTGDVVLELLVEDGRVVEHPQLAVDLHARVAVRPQLLEELAVLALAPADHRRHDHEALALGQLHDLVDDLLGRLAGDRRAAVEAVRMARPATTAAAGSRRSP
jgi:hypothetical protein